MLKINEESILNTIQGSYKNYQKNKTKKSEEGN